MRSRGIVLFLCLVSLVSWTGCGTLKQKFIRPSKGKAVPPVQLHYEERTYVRPPHRLQYQEAYLLWKAWHLEGLNALGGLNRKRSRTSLGHALEQLATMKGLLEEGKAQELSRHMERLQKAQGELGTTQPTQLDRIRVLFERELRQIETTFSLDQVHSFLLPDS